jgi:uncharacterized metal-binding protein
MVNKIAQQIEACRPGPSSPTAYVAIISGQNFDVYGVYEVCSLQKCFLHFVKLGNGRSNRLCIRGLVAAIIDVIIIIIIIIIDLFPNDNLHHSVHRHQRHFRHH